MAKVKRNIVLLMLGIAAVSHVGRAQDIYVQPWETTTVYLVCQSGQVWLQNCNVSASIAAVEPTGGHCHGGTPRYGNPRQGTLNPSSGNTGTQGYVSSLYSATRIAQAEKVTVCAQGGGCTESFIQVRRPNLVEMWGGWAHVMIGSTSSHVFNHFFTPTTRDRVLAVVAQYANEYSGASGLPEPWEPVGVNDSSLPTGGVFDICATVSTCAPSAQNPSGGANPWSGPHQSSAHDNGDAADFRGNTQPNNIINDTAVKNRFRQICQQQGLPVAIHESIGSSNEHIHCAAY